MSDITVPEFILARVAEDEYLWNFGDPGPRCAAYRSIVDLHKVNSEPTVWGTGAGPDSGKPTGGTTYWCWTCDYDRDYGHIGGPREGCETLRALALIWADHPDFRPEWRL